MLRLVEIELNSYCNRKCNWCPNNLIDRHSDVNIMDYDTINSLIVDLKRMNYKGYISYSRYNEPFAFLYPTSNEKSPYLNMRWLKQELPNCTFISNTNGDYFTLKGCFSIVSKVIDELTIMNYDGLTKEKCINNLRYWTANDDLEIIEVNKGLYAEFKNMKILYANWGDFTISDRGGVLPTYSLSESLVRPCYEPLYFIGINYDGSVSPCCNIRNDIDHHKNYILGNIKQNSLQEMLKNDKMLDFQYFAHNRMNICGTCSNCGGRYTRKEGGILYE